MEPLILDGKDLSPSDSESDATCKVTEDEDYYFYFVKFEVEDRLFRVPIYQFFQESPDFSEMYALSAHIWEEDGDPIKLEMVTRDDFRSLLKVLYPSCLPWELTLSGKEWTSVLTLASRWRFLRVRNMAKGVIELMDSLTPVEKICLGRDLSISSWVIDGFVGLVEATTITDEEALQIDLGAETTAYNLFRIRELKSISARTKVKEVFKEELDRLRTMEKAFSNTNEEIRQLLKTKLAESRTRRS